ncbi:MAG TPA: glycosyltransferase [Ktedonobacterales bacterium]|nr:glycosyltransferase [Ktedonobacterales bacterium]
MNIVIVTDQFPPMVGGVATVTHQLSVRLAERGHHVTVVAPSENWHNEQNHEQEIHIYRFSSFEWPAYEGQRIAFLPFLALRRLFQKIQPDVVHIHSPLVLGTLARVVAHTLHIPVIATNHFMPINLSRSLVGDGPVGKTYSKVVYRYLVGFYQRCDYVTAPTSTAFKLLVEQSLHTPGEALSNGIDLTRFRPEPRDECLRRALGLPADRPLALILTRLMEEKRVHILLQAMKQVQEPVHLAVAGTGPDASALQTLAHRLGISQQVTFLGFVPDEQIVPLYSLADFFVMPSVAELQSLATLEAMACGLPVIAADAGALPELVKPGQNGYLFPSDKSDQLAFYLDKLLRQPQQWQAMRHQSLEMAAQHGYQHILERWEAIYQARGNPHSSATAATPQPRGVMLL